MRKVSFLSVVTVYALFQTVAILMSTATATAQSTSGFKHDSTQPIEIASDTLEVRQADQKAIFAGDVRARQGKAYMQANTFEVTYNQNTNSDNNTTDNGRMGGIKRVRATGNVFLSTGTESAQGDWADYNVETGKITMGDNVALTQNKNVITGSRLNINLESGQARIEGSKKGGNSGRVKSIFVPQQSKNP